MSNICAGIGRGQITIINDHLAHHKHVQKMYEELLADVPGIHVHSQPNTNFTNGTNKEPVYDSNYWLCTITIDENVKVKGQEDAPAYVNGVSEAIFKVGMCLPAGPYVSDDDVKYIVETIKAAIE